MQKKHLGLLAAVVAVTAVFAVFGTVGGEYLADRLGSRSVESTGDPSLTGSATPDADPAESSSPRPAESPTPVSRTPEADIPPGDLANGTYRIDRVMYDQSALTVTLVSAEVVDGRLRLNLTYRNNSASSWPVSCPTAEIDLTSSEVTLSDGRAVHPMDTWCIKERAGEFFSIAAGREVSTWAIYPTVPERTESFDVTWYDFPTLKAVQLR
ncbi:hypothetical protein ABT336_22885 [Micromonospora sp. NPDC000207]|uniref:hypothetical protein n=1 Tax=Micromonospora sp. NPDC000207 TaxID=3154246 RepID=UPI00331BC676